MNLLDEFRMAVTALETAGIPYAVCGGMAMTANGHARATQDIDFLIAMKRRSGRLQDLADIELLEGGWDWGVTPTSGKGMRLGFGKHPGSRVIGKEVPAA